MNALAEFLSPEAGQRRRAWLDRQGNALDERLQYYLGPHLYPPVNALAQAVPMAMSGTDWVDAQTAGNALMRSREPWEAVGHAGALAGAGAAMMVPGMSYRMAQQATDAGVSAARFVRDEAGSVGRAGDETPAQEIARLLREGRAAEVTDDMMARADPQELHRLYTSGATGQAMPMDEASRMARAEGMGFDTGTPLYHGTRKDFPAFDNNAARTTDHGWYGDGTYFGAADTADAYAQAERWNGRTIPAYASGRRMQWPEGQAPAMTPQDAAGIRQGVTQQGYSGIDINAPNDFDTWGDAAGKWRETVIFDPANIRSRFARFDPRLSHLAHLSAGIGGVAAGNALYSQPQQSDDALWSEVREYLRSVGALE
jgi:hypothetical protein